MDLTQTARVGLWIHRTERAIGCLHTIQALGFDYLAPTPVGKTAAPWAF
jgi:hypothetical protein